MKYTKKYATSNLDLCMTKYDWSHWFETNGNHDMCDGWNDFDLWFHDMIGGGDLIVCNAAAYFTVKSIVTDQDVPVLISVYETRDHMADYYSIAYDGGSIAGDLEDIDQDFHALTGMSLKEYLIFLLKERGSDLLESDGAITFVLGNKEVVVSSNDIGRLIECIDFISRR